MLHWCICMTLNMVYVATVVRLNVLCYINQSAYRIPIPLWLDPSHDVHCSTKNNPCAAYNIRLETMDVQVAEHLHSINGYKSNKFVILTTIKTIKIYPKLSSSSWRFWDLIILQSLSKNVYPLKWCSWKFEARPQIPPTYSKLMNCSLARTWRRGIWKGPMTPYTPPPR